MSTRRKTRVDFLFKKNKNMEKIIRKIKLQLKATITRFICWLSYGIGCYRNITGTLKIYKNYTIKDLEKELYILINISDSTGLDCDYLKKMVSVRLSAGILRLLEIGGYKKIEITSTPGELKKIIEENLKIEITETDYGKYRHTIEQKNNILSSSIDCDNGNRRRFELYNIVLSSIKEGN